MYYKVQLKINVNLYRYHCKKGGHLGRDRMVVGFTTTLGS